MESAHSWLDQHARWTPGTSRRKALAICSTLPIRELTDRSRRRAKVNRSDMASALADYYQDPTSEYDLYRIDCDGQKIETSILTRPDWLDLDCPLDSRRDRLTLTTSQARDTPASFIDLDAALRRLSEATALDVPIANLPLYRLLRTDTGHGRLNGSLGIAPFAQYALTLDLLEAELLDALSSDAAMPLRTRYLPNLEAVLDLPQRLCAGGVLALCAIARPAEVTGDEPDYALLVQERSDRVVNGARRLAVIPKGFHEPLTDFQADASIGATLRREIEEELFGRIDVDTTMGEPRHTAPMHSSRLSEPMRWLTDEPGRLRLECTGFGLNLVNGNYEYACLIVIDDEEFWARYGGWIESNWETRGFRLYSSRNRALLTELAADEAWSNEGLFAFFQGIRHLNEIGGSRVQLPAVSRH